MSVRHVTAAAMLVALTLVGGAETAHAASATNPPNPSSPASADGTTSGSTSTSSPHRVTFGIGAASKGKLDGRTAIQVVVPRGGTYKDQVVVVNLAYTPLTLSLYSVDVHNDANGRLEPDVASVTPKDLGAWVALATPGGTRQIKVPAKGRLVVPLTVHVPRNAPVGDHLSGVMVGLHAQAQGSGQTSTDLNVEQRVGLRLSVRVAGQLRARLTVVNLSATYSGTVNPFGKGSARVTYTVRNDGNVRLGGTQQLSIHGLLGSAAPNVTLPEVPVLLPGGSATFSVDVPDVVPVGLLTAEVSVAATSAAGDANPPADLAVGTARFWAIDWTLLALALALSILLAWWYRHRRRRAPVAPGRREVGARADLVSSGDSI